MKAIQFFISAILFCTAAFTQSPSCSNVIKEDSVRFSRKSVFLNWAAKKKLYHIAMELKKNSDCKIAVTGYGNSCLTCQQTSWDRVYSVIKYLRQWGVDSTRFICPGWVQSTGCNYKKPVARRRWPSYGRAGHSLL